jgi:hypothetical protein
MHWARAYPRLGSSLALFGLTLQLALSLGHLHLEHIAEQRAIGIAAGSGADTRDAPPPDSDPRHQDEYCAIYAFITLIGSARSADPPVFLFPHALVGDPLSPCRAFHVAKPAGVIPQARAPPRA